MADAYVNVVVRPVFSERLAALPEADRPEAERRTQEWFAAARAAVIDYETMPLRFEAVLDMRSRHYSPELREQMVAHHARLVASGVENNLAIARAFALGINQNDVRRGGRPREIDERWLVDLITQARDDLFRVSPMGAVSGEQAVAMRSYMPSWPHDRPPHRLNYLAGPGLAYLTPPGRPGLGLRLDYSGYRLQIISGSLRPPPWVPDPSTDPCTGVPVAAVSAPSSPPTAPAPAAGARTPAAGETDARSLLPQQRR
jgi:hypothetical protein